MVYLYVFLLLLILSLFLSVKKAKSKILYFIWGIGLTLIVGFRNPGFFADTSEYIDAVGDWTDGRMEPTFMAISYAIKKWSLPATFIFLIYSILGIGLKMKAIYRWTPYIWLSMAVYIAHLLSAQECAAIRVGVATAVSLLGLYDYCEGNRKKWLLYTVFAALFHYSAVLMLLCPLFLKIPVKFKYWLPIICIAYTFPLFKISFIELLGFILRNDFMSYYSHYILTDNTVNVFNFSQIFYCVIALHVVKNIESYKKLYPYSGELVTVYIMSLVMLPLFFQTPVFAFRLSQLFAGVEIILIPIVIKYLLIHKKKIFANFIIVYLFYWCFISLKNVIEL